jgi:DNA-binding CsgD family transcriptional regulator
MTVKIERLLEVLHATGSIESLGDVINAIRDVYDIDHVIYYAISLGHQPFVLASRDEAGLLSKSSGFWKREAASLAALTYPTDWINQYQEAGYTRTDPVIDSAMKSFVPVDWHDIAWDTPKKRAFLREAVECGIGNHGYTIPIRGPDGQFAAFTINKSCSDEQWTSLMKDSARDFMLIASYFHQRVLEIEKIFGSPPAPSLSSRERDVLCMIAQGRSRGQVASSLKISENTLRVYLDSARHKLSALNIQHAVAIAATKGYINI